jgi:hypothetical protein
MIINYYWATNKTDTPQRVQHPTLRKFVQVRRLPSELATADGATLPIKNGVVIVPPGVCVAFPGPVYNTCVKNSSRFEAHGSTPPKVKKPTVPKTAAQKKTATAKRAAKKAAKVEEVVPAVEVDPEAEETTEVAEVNDPEIEE